MMRAQASRTLKVVAATRSTQLAARSAVVPVCLDIFYGVERTPTQSCGYRACVPMQPFPTQHNLPTSRHRTTSLTSRAAATCSLSSCLRRPPSSVVGMSCSPKIHRRSASANSRSWSRRRRRRRRQALRPHTRRCARVRQSTMRRRCVPLADGTVSRH